MLDPRGDEMPEPWILRLVKKKSRQEKEERHMKRVDNLMAGPKDPDMPEHNQNNADPFCIVNPGDTPAGSEFRHVSISSMSGLRPNTRGRKIAVMGNSRHRYRVSGHYLSSRCLSLMHVNRLLRGTEKPGVSLPGA
jgi:hypothetical protein